MIIDPVEHRLGVDAQSSRRSRTAELPQRICQDQPRSSRFPPASLNRSDRPTLASASRRGRPRLFTLAPAIPCASGGAQASRLGSDYLGASPTKSAAPPPSSRARLRARRRHDFGRAPARPGPRCTSQASLQERTPNGNSMPTFGSACIKPAPALGLNRPRPNACLRGLLWAHDDQAWARLIGSAAISWQRHTPGVVTDKLPPTPLRRGFGRARVAGRSLRRRRAITLVDA